MGTIYRKTAEGQAEIETRVRKLSPRLRSALIMIDGKRTDEELRKLLAQQADETLRREAVRAVNDLLGPMGEMVALKLEQAKNPEELRNALEKAVPVIGNAR